jgi:hypothetical protein
LEFVIDKTGSYKEVNRERISKLQQQQEFSWDFVEWRETKLFM